MMCEEFDETEVGGLLEAAAELGGGALHELARRHLAELKQLVRDQVFFAEQAALRRDRDRWRSRAEQALALNPDGLNAPALVETVEILAAQIGPEGDSAAAFAAKLRGLFGALLQGGEPTHAFLFRVAERLESANLAFDDDAVLRLRRMADDLEVFEQAL